jgi:hypothetical protein
MQRIGIAGAFAGVEAPGRRILGEIPVVLILRPLLSAGVDLAAIVLAALARVRKDLVGGGDLREALGDVRLVGIEVGMQLLGETPVVALDVVLAGVAADAEGGIEVLANG